jgi:hypothetical protein
MVKKDGIIEIGCAFQNYFQNLSQKYQEIYKILPASQLEKKRVVICEIVNHQDIEVSKPFFTILTRKSPNFLGEFEREYKDPTVKGFFQGKE